MKELISILLFFAVLIVGFGFIGRQVELNSHSSFDDVHDTHPNSVAIAHLENLGLVKGTSGKNFEPDKGITRAELAVILVRTQEGKDFEPDDFATGLFDDAVGHWAEKWIKAAWASGLMRPCEFNKFCPDAGITRGDAAQLFTEGY